MTTIDTTTTTVEPPSDDFVIDDTQLAAVAFLARYSGRTLDAYRHDLRGFFQWAADIQLTVLAATRPHIELFRSWTRPRRPGGASRVERTASERGLRHQRRGPRHRTRPPHAAHPRQGQQARHCVRSIGKRAGLGAVHPHMLRAAFIIEPTPTTCGSQHRRFTSAHHSSPPTTSSRIHPD